MLRYSLHLLILLLLAAFPAQSQNAKADILRINAAYSKFTDMSMNITYDVYLNAASTVPYQTEVGSYKQHGNLRYSRLKEIESLQNSKYLIVADNDQKYRTVYLLNSKLC